jgi:hypothetical protein
MVAIMSRLIRIIARVLAAVAFLVIATPAVVYAPMVARCTDVAEDWYAQTSAAMRSQSTAARQAMAREARGWLLSGYVSSKLMTDDRCLGSDQQTVERHVDVLALSAWLSIWFSEDERTALLFSRTYMGPGIYGWDNAARAYYGRELNHLRNDELKCLARRTRNPSRPRCERQ